MRQKIIYNIVSVSVDTGTICLGKERVLRAAYARMLNFFRDNARTIRRLNLYQFGAAFLAILLGLAVPMKRVAGEEIPRENMTLLLLTSIFAVCFFLYLNHTVVWEEGAKSRIRVDAGRARYNPFGGLLIGLAAFLPNILLGILAAGGYFFGTPDGLFGWKFAAMVSDVAGGIAMVWQGMFLGIIRYLAPDNMYVFLLVPILPILGCWLSYWLGLKQWHLPALSKSKKTQKPSAKK